MRNHGKTKKGMLGQHLFLCCLLCVFCFFKLLLLFNVCSLCFFSRGGFGAILMLKRCVDVWIGWCFVCGLQFLILSSFPFNPTNIWLVVLIILKHMKSNGKDYPIYYGKKFETTNQVFNNC